MPPLCVLVVENDMLLRQSVIDMLHDLGHLPLGAVNGASALRMLQANDSPEIMLVDVGLPDMDGRELAKQARRLRPDIHIVFMTGHVVTAVNDVGRELMARYLPKPFRHRDLERVLCDLAGVAEQTA